MLESYKEDLPPTLVGILEMERREGIELGIEKGIEQGINQIITSLIKNGFTDEVIANIAKRTIEEVKAIRSACLEEK